jgi:hypothetical protein
VGRPGFPRVGLAAGVVLCLADWVFIEDFGFLGGVGTDPNSMIPIALLFAPGYLAIAKLPLTADNAAEFAPAASWAAGRSWPERLLADPTFAFRCIAAVVAVAITLVGAAPMALAASDGHSDPILNQAINGTGTAADTPAPAFSLIDQHGRPVSFASLHGKELALTYLDPVRTSDCPIIQRQSPLPRHRLPGRLRPGRSRPGPQLALSDRIAPSTLRSMALLRHPDQPRPRRRHDRPREIAYFIDANGQTRDILDTNPGPATEATQSSFAVTLTAALQRVRGPPEPDNQVATAPQGFSPAANRLPDQRRPVGPQRHRVRPPTRQTADR